MMLFSYSLRPVYTWRTLTGVKLNNNWAQYSRPAIFLASKPRHWAGTTL